MQGFLKFHGNNFSHRYLNKFIGYFYTFTVLFGINIMIKFITVIVLTYRRRPILRNPLNSQILKQNESEGERTAGVGLNDGD
jgi:hypothetical protein